MARLLRLLPDPACAHEPGVVDPPKITLVSLAAVAVNRITRMALTLGGAHGIFKASRLEQLFRDGALGPLQPPPSEFCLYNIGFYELDIDPADVLPPMKPAQ
jgi:hypothetical protein